MNTTQTPPTPAAPATKKKAARDWQCNECGKRFTVKQAKRALYGDGCTCGGYDIDHAAASFGARPYVHRGEYHGPWQHIETVPCVGWRIVADELPKRDGWDVRAVHDSGTRVPVGLNRHADPAPEMQRLNVLLTGPVSR